MREILIKMRTKAARAATGRSSEIKFSKLRSAGMKFKISSKAASSAELKRNLG
ncbi:MAG: hypothetical protein ACTTJF_04195 [Campylobacter sp.]|uniref:hypothetical protein n=1 Tax=Campylobacter sp. TaxID=205 RepID=UPI003F9F3DB2